MGTPDRVEIEAQIAALHAELAAAEGGVYQDAGKRPAGSRASRGRRRTTTRRRSPDGSELGTREQALMANAQWGPAGRRRGAIGRERFESYGRRISATPRAK